MHKLYRKMIIMVIILYKLYIFVWIKHGCLANMVFALEHRDSVIKRLWYILTVKEVVVYINSQRGCGIY